MPRPKKPGPVEYPQVGLRGKLLDAVKVVAHGDGISLPDAVRRVIDLWIKSPDGRKYFRENYGVDVKTLGSSNVVPIDDPRRGSNRA